MKTLRFTWTDGEIHVVNLSDACAEAFTAWQDARRKHEDDMPHLTQFAALALTSCDTEAFSLFALMNREIGLARGVTEEQIEAATKALEQKYNLSRIELRERRRTKAILL